MSYEEKQEGKTYIMMEEQKTQEEIQEFFLSEFLEDFYEVIDERRLMCE